MFLLNGMKVCATTSYFTNSNGVNLSESEYNFVSDVFWEGFQEIMTIEDYNKIFDDDLIGKEIVKKTYTKYIPNNTRGTTVTTPQVQLTITKVCNTNCLITTTARWLALANIRSYDVIGAYLQNTSLVSTVTTRAVTTSASQSSNSIKNTSNGFGVSIKSPSGSNLTINQYYSVSLGGHVYASYQHAIRNITLTNSQQYTISRSGYGGVFLFNSPYNSYYDNMSGVDITV